MDRRNLPPGVWLDAFDMNSLIHNQGIDILNNMGVLFSNIHFVETLTKSMGFVDKQRVKHMMDDVVNAQISYIVKAADASL